MTYTRKAMMDNCEWLAYICIHMQHLERPTVTMYNKGCRVSCVHGARPHLFPHEFCSVEDIPPTQAALYHYTKQGVDD